MRRLFTLRDYPQEVGALYAEGYSVANFLVAASNRPAFLAFVAQGMQGDWDSAVQAHYRYQNIEQLEEAWKSYLRSTKHQPPTILAQNTSPTPADPAKRVVVRLTAPPVQPLAGGPLPIIRAQSPDPEPRDQLTLPTSRPTGSRPGYLPNYDSNPAAVSAAPSSPPRDPWQPPGARLGMPQFLQPAAPVGYPN